MRNLVRANGPYLVGWQRDHSNRIIAESHEFDRIALPLLMDHHPCADITGLESALRHIRRQDDTRQYDQATSPMHV
jgi:hypothetical protein